jgi:ATP-binding cassette, subfamily B, bacterial PglK
MTTVPRRMFSLLTPSERRQAYVLSLGLLGIAIIQVASIASVMPFMAVVGDPAIIQRSAPLRWTYAALGFQDDRAFLVFLGALILVVLVASNAFSAFMEWRVLRFTWMRGHTLSLRLLEKYVGQPYVFFLEQNSANLSKNILTEVSQVITGVLLPLMQIFARSLVVLLIAVTLLIVDPLLAVLSAVVLGGAYLLIYSRFRRKLGEIGREKVIADRARYTAAAEVFGGIKELKLLGRESEYLGRFGGPSSLYAQHQATRQAVGKIPRYALEVVAFGGLLAIVLVLLASREGLGEILPLFALFAFAGYRLMPALQNIFSDVTIIRFHAAALDVLYQDLGPYDPGEGEPVSDDGPPLRLNRELALRDVTFTYPNAPTAALNGVNVEIPMNATVGIVGSTGSGKTTAVDLILGLLEPTQGSLILDGEPITAVTRSRWQRNVGYVPQHIFLCDDSIAANIAFGIAPERVSMNAVEQAARIAQLHDFVQELSAGYDTVVGERGVRLSGGQRQRIGIARALYHRPDVVVLDEATSALDGLTEAEVMEAIARMKGQKTIVIVAHRLSTVRACDTIYVFERGQVVAHGPFDELMRTNAHFGKMARSAAVNS